MDISTNLPPNQNQAPAPRPVHPEQSLGRTPVELSQPGMTPEAAPPPIEQAPVPGQSPASAVVQTTSPQPATPPPTAHVQPPATSLHTGAHQARLLQAGALSQLPAADEDLIEKEWVDTAENVIETHQDDPFAEDHDQHVMSSVYLKKRFNLDVS